MTIQQDHQALAVLVGMEPANYYWKLLATNLEQHQIPWEQKANNPRKLGTVMDKVTYLHLAINKGAFGCNSGAERSQKQVCVSVQVLWLDADQR